MVKFTIRRVLQAIPTIIGITIISFAIMVLSPGNPASQLTAQDPTLTARQREAIAEAMGVNAPFHEQYARWLIGDAPVTFGPIGFGITTVDACRLGVSGREEMPEVCEGMNFSARDITVEESQLVLDGEPVDLSQALRVIDAGDLTIDGGNIVLDGEVITVPDDDFRVVGVTRLNGEIVRAPGSSQVVDSTGITIDGRVVQPTDEVFLSGTEIVAVNGVLTDAATRSGYIELTDEGILFNGELVEGETVINERNLAVIIDGEQFTYNNRDVVVINDGAIIIEDGAISSLDGMVEIISGAQIERDGDTLLADGEALDIGEFEVGTTESGNLRLDVKTITDESELIFVNGVLAEIDVNVERVSGEKVVLTSLRNVTRNEPIQFVTGADLVIDNSGIRIQETFLNPGDEVLLVDNTIVMVNDSVTTEDRNIFYDAQDGQILTEDWQVIDGDAIWENEVVIWAGRQLPVIDNRGYIVEGEFRTGAAEGILRGDLGFSLISQRSVSELIAEKLPATVELGALALAVGLLIGIPIGVLAAVYQGSLFDQVTRIGAVIVSAIPVFWLGLILLLIFGAMLDWLPMGNRFPISVTGEYTLWERIQHLILPVFTLSSFSIATFSRFMRASLLDVLNQDYIRTARAKGLGNRRVWFLHGLRNALIPIATLLGPAITGIIGGAVLTETIYSWPGMGRFVVDSVQQQDYPVIMATVILFSVATVIGFLLSDLFYAALDPRIRLS